MSHGPVSKESSEFDPICTSFTPGKWDRTKGQWCLVRSDLDKFTQVCSHKCKAHGAVEVPRLDYESRSQST